MQRDWSGLALVCGAAIAVAALIWGDEGATQGVTTVLIAAIAAKISKDKIDAKSDVADIKHAVNGVLTQRVKDAVTEATTSLHHRLDRIEADVATLKQRGEPDA